MRVTSFLSEKLNQNPLKRFLDAYIKKGRINENPTMAEFLKITQSITIISSILLKDITGNYHEGKRKTYDLESINM